MLCSRISNGRSVFGLTGTSQKSAPWLAVACAVAVLVAGATSRAESPAASPAGARQRSTPHRQVAANGSRVVQAPAARSEPAPALDLVDRPTVVSPCPSCPPNAASCPRCGVYCYNGNCYPEPGWDAIGPIPWEVFAQGEYIGPHRLPHVPEYRLRTDDVLEFVFRLTARASSERYQLQPGDQLRFESLSAEEYSREWVVVEPDGYISLPFGQVYAAGLTLEQLSQTLEKELAEAGVQEPRVAVAPALPRDSEAGRPPINTRLEELRNTVDARQAVTGGQTTRATVTPEGTVQLPAIGSVPATGLTLPELKREIEFRYDQIVDGLEVTPALAERAPRYVFVLGEVRNPGRYTLEGPTTLMQAISLAGSWNVGAHLRGIVVFRRDDNWQLMATKLDIHGALFGKRPCPADEIWLRDSDIVLVPQSPILATDNLIELVFTRGIYSVMPFGTSWSWSSLLFVDDATGVVIGE